MLNADNYNWNRSVRVKERERERKRKRVGRQTEVSKYSKTEMNAVETVEFYRT